MKSRPEIKVCENAFTLQNTRSILTCFCYKIEKILYNLFDLLTTLYIHYLTKLNKIE